MFTIDDLTRALCLTHENSFSIPSNYIFDELPHWKKIEFRVEAKKVIRALKCLQRIDKARGIIEMKKADIEKTFKDCVATSITFIDGKNLILYSDKEFTKKELDVLMSMTSEEFKTSILSTMRFDKHKIED